MKSWKASRFTTTGAHQLLVGVLLGALAGLLGSVLGIWQIASWGATYGIALTAIVGGFVTALGGSRLLAIIDSVVLVAAALVAHTPVIQGPVSRWVREDIPVKTGLDVVIVLSSSVGPDSSLDAAGVDRLLQGLELIQLGVAPRLLTTRVIRNAHRDSISSDLDQARLVRMAKAESSWSVMGSVHSTRDEALRAAAILQPGYRRIAIVTSPMHTRRACEAFEAVGFIVSCIPARERSATTRHPQTPEARLAAFRAYLYERLAMKKYEMNGWVGIRR